MRVPERIKYLKKNKKRGDIKTIATLFEMKPVTVHHIVNGAFVGSNGEKVLEKLEQIIEERAIKEKAMSEKYREKLKAS